MLHTHPFRGHTDIPLAANVLADFAYIQLQSYDFLEWASLARSERSNARSRFPSSSR
jgi:hypothetical protein